MQVLSLIILILMSTNLVYSAEFQCEVYIDTIENESISNFVIPDQFGESNQFVISELPENHLHTLLTGQSDNHHFEIFLVKFSDENNVLNLSVNYMVKYHGHLEKGEKQNAPVIFTLSADGNAQAGVSLNLYDKEINFEKHTVLFENKMSVDCRKYEHKTPDTSKETQNFNQLK